MNIRILLPVMLLALSLSSAKANEGEEKHDVIRNLRQQGDILPLEEIIKHARQYVDGRVIETEMEIHQDRYIYEIEILDRQGYVREIRFDAKTGERVMEDQED